MKIVVPSNHARGIEIPISADIKKAFQKYYKNSVVVDYENDTYTPDVLMYSWLASFAESEEYKSMEAEAEKAKAEAKAEKEKAKAEREAKKAQREAEREAKKAEKIAKLQAEIEKLKTAEETKED